MQMTHLSLFSGIGGIDLAAEWAGFKTVAFVERDEFCQKVLAKHWPGVPIYNDVTKFGKESMADAQKLHGNGGELYGKHGNRRVSKPRDGGAPKSTIHLLSGGFPCQPFSVAGKRKGVGDERFLWHEMLRVIREVEPLWVLGENVRGLLSIDGGRTFGTIIHELAEVGYRVGWGVYGACHVAAPHRRERVFIVAHSDKFGGAKFSDVGRRGRGLHGRNGKAETADQERDRLDGPREDGGYGDVADACLQPDGKASAPAVSIGGRWNARHDACWSGRGCVPRVGRWEPEPNVGRVANGVPNRVDRLRALGNAVVPQQVYPILQAIADEVQRCGR